MAAPTQEAMQKNSQVVWIRSLSEAPAVTTRVLLIVKECSPTARRVPHTTLARPGSCELLHFGLANQLGQENSVSLLPHLPETTIANRQGTRILPTTGKSSSKTTRANPPITGKNPPRFAQN